MLSDFTDLYCICVCYRKDLTIVDNRSSTSSRTCVEVEQDSGLTDGHATEEVPLAQLHQHRAVGPQLTQVQRRKPEKQCGHVTSVV